MAHLPRPLISLSGAMWVFATALILPAKASGIPERSTRPTASTDQAITETVLTSVADSWGWRSLVRDNYPGSHGRGPLLETGTDDALGIRLAFVRFDWSALSSALGPDVESVHLEMYVEEESAPTSRLTSIELIFGVWDEDSLLDDRLPTTGNPVTSTSSSGLGWQSWDVTGALGHYSDGRPFWRGEGLALRTWGDGNFRRAFSSREGNHPPRLIVRYHAPSQALPNLNGYAWMNCGGSLIHITLRNTGKADAGAFTVRSENGAPSWRVGGLKAGETLTLEPKPKPRRPELLSVDADNEVVESSEMDNELAVSVPDCGGLFLPRLWSNKGRR